MTMTSTAPLSLHPQPRMKVCMLARQWHSKAPDRWVTTTTATSAALTRCRLVPPLPPPRHRRRCRRLCFNSRCCWSLLPLQRYHAATAKCRCRAIAVAAAALPAAAAQLPRFPPSPRCHQQCHSAATVAVLPLPPPRRCQHWRRHQANNAATTAALPLMPRCHRCCQRHHCFCFCCCHRLRRQRRYAAAALPPTPPIPPSLL